MSEPLSATFRHRQTMAGAVRFTTPELAETESRINGLELGADDYVPKPFEPRELSLRIANILKRTIPAPPPAVESARFGDFVFHLGRGELKRGEEIIHLTDRERDMLRVLAAAPGETVPRMALAGNGMPWIFSAGAFGVQPVSGSLGHCMRQRSC